MAWKCTSKPQSVRNPHKKPKYLIQHQPQPSISDTIAIAVADIATAIISGLKGHGVVPSDFYPKIQNKHPNLHGTGVLFLGSGTLFLKMWSNSILHNIFLKRVPDPKKSVILITCQNE